MKFNPKFKSLTQKIQIKKARNFEKMAADEAFLMTSPVLILAIFLRRRWCFFQRMRVPTNGEDATDCCNSGNPALSKTTAIAVSTVDNSVRLEFIIMKVLSSNWRTLRKYF